MEETHKLQVDVLDQFIVGCHLHTFCDGRKPSCHASLCNAHKVMTSVILGHYLCWAGPVIEGEIEFAETLGTEVSQESADDFHLTNLAAEHIEDFNPCT